MSIQDDIFDIEDYLRSKEMKSAFERITNRIQECEQENEEIYKDMAALKRVIKRRLL